MKKLLIATAVAATLFAPQAFAQAKKFEGFSVAGNLVFTNSKVTATNTTGYAGDASATATNLALQGQYAWALGDKFVLGAGAQLGIGDVKGGTLSGLTTEYTGKNWNSLYVAPGYAASETLLVYGKVAALTADGELNIAGTSKSSISGTGFGFGVQSMMNKNMFIQAEYMVSNYGDVTNTGLTTKYKNSQLSFGVGYKF